VHLPHLSVPALLLSLLYATALAVAATAPGTHTVAGLVVLAGLVSRWALRHRAHARTPVLRAEPVVVPAPATPA
jgi:hypothetical protein